MNEKADGVYEFESKRDYLYVKNREALRLAIEASGGAGDFVISKIAEQLLDTLARNNIEITAKYTGERTC